MKIFEQINVGRRHLFPNYNNVINELGMFRREDKV